MEQVAHTWIAIRAIALLEDEGKTKDLVDLLKPYANAASAGAWLPDLALATRRGTGASIYHHTMKMAPYTEADQVKRFTMDRKTLVSKLGPGREMAAYLKGKDPLGDAWWSAPYKGDAPPGRHIPNGAMALGTTIKHLLIMGDPQLEALVPGDLKDRQYVNADCCTRKQAAAMYLFMLSHFVADACMPLHCDKRKLAGGPLHKGWEDYWKAKVGDGFSKEKLHPATPDSDTDKLLKDARGRDGEFGLNFGDNAIPGPRPNADLWLDTMYVCRASFALNSIACSPNEYPYGGAKTPSFSTMLSEGNPELLADLNRVVLHDAVLNTAMAWKHIWESFEKSG